MKDLEIIPVNCDIYYVNRCIELAKQSTCYRRRCGSIVVGNMGEIIGRGYNSQPCNVVGDCFKDTLPANFKSDRTCCVHAEQRAIIDAGKQANGSDLYFVSIGENDQPVSCGEPYCTICSKMALDAGISRFILYHADGLRSYAADYYNKLSFQYKP